VPQGVVAGELLDQITLPLRMISSVEGLRDLVALPVAAIMRWREFGACGSNARRIGPEEGNRG